MYTDLTPELAKLMQFTGRVATAIRLHSAYNQGAPRSPDSPTDLMFLSDALHHFERLGLDILRREPNTIAQTCDALIKVYEDYEREDPRFSRQSKPTFERNAHLFSLDEAKDLFRDIQRKVINTSQSAQLPS